MSEAIDYCPKSSSCSRINGHDGPCTVSPKPDIKPEWLSEIKASVVSLKPGDVIIVKFDRPVPSSKQEAIGALFKKAFPNHTTLTLSEDVDIGIIHEEKA